MPQVPTKLSRRAWALMLIAPALIVGFAAASWHYALPESGAGAPAVALFAGDRLIGAIYPAHRAQSWVSLDRMPRSVVDAVLTAEDRRFWSHSGVDLLAVARALRVDVHSGELRQGGSTITQQLARTLFLDGRRTWARKARETVIALLLELRYSKKRILEAYLNSVYLGQDADVPVYGLPAASRLFLGKDVSALGLDEAAWLAGAIRAPNRLLSGARASARARRDEVLAAMQEQGLADAGAMRQALAKPLPPSPRSTRVAPYFVDFVAAELDRRAAQPVTGDMQVRTTLDLSLQRVAETAVSDGISRIEKAQPRLAGQVQAAVVAIDPASGEIRALVGGRRYADTSFNRVTRAVRQPGSLFKPFVYLTAFETERGGQGLTPASILADEPLSLPDEAGTWEPRNFDGRFQGPVTVRQALEQSLNIPAIRVAMDLGPRRVADVAHAAGIERPLAPVPSLALGTSEVTLLEITNAFATLANGGVRTPTTAIVQDTSAAEPVLAPLPASSRAVSAESAFLVTHLLRGVMRRGTGAGSSAWGLQEVTAGKTGTTDGLRDAWFVGYTPDLVVGVWVGLDDSTPLRLTGAQAALPIWGPVMQAAVRRSPPGPFTPPPGVVLTDVDRRTGRQASLLCGSDDVVREAFRKGTSPVEGCDSVVQSGLAAVSRWFASLLK